ncbi:alpha/beta hydrolase [Mitsuaria sp. GD03876]|uniref:alpha/beta fold hydrolase n=1 Tax=Mitsuaria sp. GD03876 TaxID=2975399 RepID=UPI00244CC8B5|nr:alpha/beta hydrolase [Mitsuaria sp. GD03876]MDH0863470.1 alpha/beta hydrolase [Mitsuaria sp. GD03876]
MPAPLAPLAPYAHVADAPEVLDDTHVSPALRTLFPGFRHVQVATAEGVHIHATVGGTGPALLLLHGHPQTRAIWHKVAPALAERFTVVAADLRGYGDSSKPEGGPRDAAYSKRAMAADLVALMRALGHERFDLLAHDRGARVAHRLAMDTPAAVRRLALLDIAPTLDMYEGANDAFARAYWHWFLLIQPAPLPERLIEADPAAYAVEVMGRRSAGLAPFDPLALAEYQRALAIPGTARGICGDYRASADLDLKHDRADRAAGHVLTMPLLALWGAQGVVHRCFEPLALWRRIAADVRGEALPCGHYIPEEAPALLLERVLPFFTADEPARAIDAAGAGAGAGAVDETRSKETQP